MNKKILLLTFFSPFILLFLWTIWLYIRQINGKEVIVTITGYDPTDLLSGHYIQYKIDWNKTNCGQFLNKICPKDKFCTEKPCRFYISEKNAEELDKLFWYRNTTNTIFEIVYSYREGKEPLAKQLLINKKDWRESLEK